MLYQLADDGTITKIKAEELTEELVKRVDETHINGYHVSTVFLGFDHNYTRTGDPILFETMIFDEQGSDVYMDRCSTLEEAKEMHQRGIAWVKIKNYCNS